MNGFRNFLVVSELKVSVYKYSSTKWRAIDGGLSLLSIVERDGSEIRIICYSIMGECIINSWIQKTNSKLISETFLQLYIMTEENEKNWEQYGIQFVETEVARNFLEIYNQMKCLKQSGLPTKSFLLTDPVKNARPDSKPMKKLTLVPSRKLHQDFYGLSQEVKKKKKTLPF